MDIIDKLISREGGDKVVNVAGDEGGLTKFGISQRSYPDLDIANLTYQQAREIYIKDFLTAPKIDNLPEYLQEAVLDYAVHSGPYYAITSLQKLLNLPQDGVIGPRTVAAANVAPSGPLLNAYTRERVGFLIRQVQKTPQKLKFLLGWVMRVLSL